MNRTGESFRIEKTLRTTFLVRVSTLLLLVFAMTWSANGQTLMWTDSFIKGDTPTVAQCMKWAEFLNQIAGKQFASVTLSGQYDQVGRTINDPAAATEIARLLSKRLPGVVVSGGHTWSVTNCQPSLCDSGPSMSLSVDGNQQECLCTDTYAIRPQSRNEDWGGINSLTSCNARDQWFKLEFASAVSVTANGPTRLCPGDSVQLTANPIICSEPTSYAWSTGDTTRTITVSRAGTYTVTVADDSGCKATSLPVEVTVSDPRINAGVDVTICEQSVQLAATIEGAPSDNATMVNSVCLFDAPGGSAGMCNFVRPTVCVERSVPVTHNEFKQQVSFSNPVALHYKLYYSSYYAADFVLKVNGNRVGTFRETVAAGVCYPIDGVSMPKTISVPAEAFRPFWREGQMNELSVEITCAVGEINITGLIIEVVTSSESYTWSPAAGLSSAFIASPTAKPDTTTTYTVTYTSPAGCTTTDQVKVEVQCIDPTPVAVCKEITLPVKEGCALAVNPDEFDGGSTSPVGAQLRYALWPEGPYPVGTTPVTFIVTDEVGRADSCKTTITVVDKILPVIVTPEDISVDNDAGVCSATLELARPQVSDNCAVATVTSDYNSAVFPEGETVVTWTATDIHGNTNTAIQKVYVINTTPVISGVVASTSDVVTDHPLDLTISHTDNNVKVATIDWGDNSAVEDVANPAALFAVSHTYGTSGTYSVKISLTDACDERNFGYQSVVVTNPAMGTVTGGGSFDSPKGAYLANPRASGKAIFAFHVSNVNRNRTPQGHVVFKFHKGRIKFRSTGIEQLYVGGETASITAAGRFNNDRGYRIFISVAAQNKDSRHNAKGKDNKHWKDSDFIRVRITDPSGAVVYDTQLGAADEAIATTPVDGVIKIDEKELRFDSGFESPVATSYEGESSSAYPNPFSEWLDVKFKSHSSERVSIQLLDLSGKVIYNEVFPVSEDGSYPIDIPERDTSGPGVYVLVIKQGHKVVFQRVVRK